MVIVPDIKGLAYEFYISIVKEQLQELIPELEVPGSVIRTKLGRGQHGPAEQESGQEEEVETILEQQYFIPLPVEDQVIKQGEGSAAKRKKQQVIIQLFGSRVHGNGKNK